MILLLLGLFMSFSASSNAHGINVSNGGDAVLCMPVQADAYAETLDYWIAVKTANVPIGLIALMRSYERDRPEFTDLEQAYKIMEAFASVFGSGSKLWRRPIPWNWENKINLYELADFYDEKHTEYLPSHCKTIQAAVRDVDTFYFNPTALAMLRNHPFALNQVTILLLHEILAKIMREGNFIYRPERIGFLLADFFVFLGRHKIIHAWADPNFCWRSFYHSNIKARQEMRSMILRSWILSPEEVGVLAPPPPNR